MAPSTRNSGVTVSGSGSAIVTDSGAIIRPQTGRIRSEAANSGNPGPRYLLVGILLGKGDRWGELATNLSETASHRAARQRLNQ